MASGLSKKHNNSSTKNLDSAGRTGSQAHYGAQATATLLSSNSNNNTQFNSNRGGNAHQQAKALLTTQMNFPSSKQQIYQAKRGLNINGNYSSRNATQTDIPKGLSGGLSNKLA